jgi:hypothetical protein
MEGRRGPKKGNAGRWADASTEKKPTERGKKKNTGRVGNECLSAHALLIPLSNFCVQTMSLLLQASARPLAAPRGALPPQRWPAGVRSRPVRAVDVSVSGRRACVRHKKIRAPPAAWETYARASVNLARLPLRPPNLWLAPGQGFLASRTGAARLVSPVGAEN